MIGDWFGTDELIDKWDFIKLISRSGLNLVCAWLVIGKIYGRLYTDRREFVFTYYLFNLITFTLCILLRKVPMELGFALGLFAVFGILKYRTEAIQIRDLTYLFVVIGLAILNAVANKKISLAELLAVDLMIIGVTAIIELSPKHRVLAETPILYDNLPLLAPGNEAELHADLTRRTGLPVIRVRVHRIDLLRDAADITAFYERAVPRNGKPSSA